MICGRQGLRKYKYRDKYRSNRQAYDDMCFCKGDDKRSLIMQNMQNRQNMQNMQNKQNISPLFFSSKDQKSKISESESLINSQTCLGHLVFFKVMTNSFQILIGDQKNWFVGWGGVKKYRIFFFKKLIFSEWSNSARKLFFFYLSPIGAYFPYFFPRFFLQFSFQLSPQLFLPKGRFG